MSITMVAAAAGSVAGVAIDHAKNLLKEMPHDGNLVSYGQAAEVVPMCLVDESCSTSELLETTLQTLLSVYAGHYFRAFTMHNISIGGTTIQKRLDKFSTQRGGPGAQSRALGAGIAGLEEYAQAFPRLDTLVTDLPEDLADLEEEGRKIEQEALKMMSVANEEQYSANRVQGSKVIKAEDIAAAKIAMEKKEKAKAEHVDLSLKQADISGPVNFATGLTMNLKITENNNTVTIPVTVRLNAMYMAPSPLVAILGFSTKDISLGARWKKWRLGGIDFWRDLVMCQDLIDEHKKNINADKTGIYLRMMNRRRQNNTVALLTGEASANNSSNIVVMMEETAAALEMKTGGRLDDFRFRERIFAQGYGMLFAVISQRRGRVRFYTRGIPDHTDVSERDMKASSKGSGGPDVADILSAFRAGSSFRM